MTKAKYEYYGIKMEIEGEPDFMEKMTDMFLRHIERETIRIEERQEEQKKTRRVFDPEVRYKPGIYVGIADAAFVKNTVKRHLDSAMMREEHKADGKCNDEAK
jgi:uncharacterized protein with FMN-binding domain